MKLLLSAIFLYFFIASTTAKVPDEQESAYAQEDGKLPVNNDINIPSNNINIPKSYSNAIPVASDDTIPSVHDSTVPSPHDINIPTAYDINIESPNDINIVPSLNIPSAHDVNVDSDNVMFFEFTNDLTVVPPLNPPSTHDINVDSDNVMYFESTNDVNVVPPLNPPPTHDINVNSANDINIQPPLIISSAQDVPSSEAGNLVAETHISDLQNSLQHLDDILQQDIFVVNNAVPTIQQELPRQQNIADTNQEADANAQIEQLLARNDFAAPVGGNLPVVDVIDAPVREPDAVTGRKDDLNIITQQQEIDEVMGKIFEATSKLKGLQKELFEETEREQSNFINDNPQDVTSEDAGFFGSFFGTLQNAQERISNLYEKIRGYREEL